MATIRVRFACGCAAVFGEEPPQDLRCETHDEHRVQSVSAPPPTFTARNCELTGPHVRKAS